MKTDVKEDEINLFDLPLLGAGNFRLLILGPPSVLKAMMRPPAVLAALGSGFAWLLWVFLRQGWKHAAFDPQAAEEQARPRTFFGFKGRPLQPWAPR